MIRTEVETLLAQLGFHGMAGALQGELTRAEHEAAPAAELLHRLLQAEAQHRRERHLSYRLTRARLPWRWPLESFPFERQPGVSKAHILTLSGLDFVRRAENLVLVGPPGPGKSGIAIAASPSASTDRPCAPPRPPRRRAPAPLLQPRPAPPHVALGRLPGPPHLPPRPLPKPDLPDLDLPDL